MKAIEKTNIHITMEKTPPHPDKNLVSIAIQLIPYKI